MNGQNFRGIFDRTITETSTLWSMVTGAFGSMTVGEWCLLITAAITVLNFIKNWYMDYKRLEMEQELHIKRMQGKIDE